MHIIEDQKPIYLDYAATTPIDNRVLQKMLPYMQQNGIFGNPASSTHVYGWAAKEAVEKSRRMMAKHLQVHHKEIIFTSGATESDNLAILGVAEGNKQRGNHIITSLTEHKAVLDTCRYLETKGYEVTYLEPDEQGLISLEKISAAIKPSTILISIMHVNNETGTIQDIAAIGELAHQNKIIFHVDAAQSIGKVDLDLSKLNVDLLSISGHKIYGPKGIGALYISKKNKFNLVAQMHGGQHEHGYRSGTLPTHQIVGLAYAIKYAMEDREIEAEKLRELEAKFLQRLSAVNGIILNGDQQAKKPGHLNFSVSGIDGEALLASVNMIAVSSGSACNSAVASSSHVLRAMQVPDHLARSALRISFGRFSTAEDAIRAAEHLVNIISRLREISPVT